MAQIKTPPTTQQPLKVDPRGKSFVLHTLAVAVMVNGFFAMDGLALDQVISAQYGGE